jgi:hypothetical protein
MCAHHLLLPLLPLFRHPASCSSLSLSSVAEGLPACLQKGKLVASQLAPDQDSLLTR